MRITLLPALLLLGAAAYGQNLTREQRIADLNQIASTFGKNYGPYEWKRDVIGFDLLDLKPWIEKAVAAPTDLDYLEVLVDYTSSLNDAHVSLQFPSTWVATLGFSVDIYDGKYLIDSLSRARLPAAQYPFVIGDELVSMDGKPVDEWVTSFRKYEIAANDRSTRRLAAALLTTRQQILMPTAPRFTPEKSTIEVRRANGDLQTYELTWLKTGVEMIPGPVVSPAIAKKRTRTALQSSLAVDGGADSQDPTLSPWMSSLAPHMQMRFPKAPEGVLNFGGRNPIFNLPANFQRRLGGLSTDAFFSGTFVADGLRIGFIRIPSFSPANTTTAINQFATELVFFEQTTDGLIIDDMRNPGGSVSYCEFLLTLLMPNTFRTLGFEIRATSSWVYSFDASVQSARTAGAPNWQIDNLLWNYQVVKDANATLRGRTGALSLNSTGSIELLPGPIVYTKPLMVLVDELSASGGDAFPAVIQDNGRGPIFGYRTMGAGGNVVGFDGTAFTETYVTITESMMNRKNPTITSEYPAAPYVENIGVRPDIVEDYMTRDNLMNGGRTFVEAFTAAMVNHIRTGGK